MSTAVPTPGLSGSEVEESADEPSGRRAIFAGEAPVKRRVPLLEQARTILELRKRKEAGTLDLRRVFRPEVVWSPEAQSRLVESVLLRIPLPAILVAEGRDGSLRIVDGLQRLTSLFQFLDGDIALVGLRLLPELDGKRFRDLEIRMRRRFEDTTITVTMLGSGADRRLVADLFDRMNAWAPLSVEEAREVLGAQRGD